MANKSFIKIAEVKVAGNSVSELHYDFTDFNIQNSGTIYYRLKIIDTDKWYSYSPIWQRLLIIISLESFQYIEIFPMKFFYSKQFSITPTNRIMI